MAWPHPLPSRVRARSLALGGCWLTVGALLLALGTVVLGRFGDGIEAATLGLGGISAGASPLVLTWYGIRFARGQSVTALRVLGDLATGASVSVALGASLDAGGALGNAIGRTMSSSLSTVGAVGVCVLVSGLITAARLTFAPRRVAPRSRALKAIDTTVPASPTVPWSPAPVAEPVESVGAVDAGEAEEDFAHASTIPSVRSPSPKRSPLRSSKTSSLPSLDLLDETSSRPSSARDAADEERTAKVLVKTLADHGVEARVEAVVEGPTVMTFEASIAPGVKVARVLVLAEEVSFSVGRKVRATVSPVAGRLAFEVPKGARATVTLHELLDDERFMSSTAALPVALGLDVRGELVTADIAKLPHLLLAGATGAGKSVGLHALLISLLYRRTAAEVRFMMIDPKAVELSVYNGLPHMVRDVVTDATEATGALAEMISEMERRYELLSVAGAKNIASYNARVPDAERLPRVVILVDEFSDLIMSQSKDKAVESAIKRLGQKARACGLHLILATQRPSVDVITGTIKSNLPGRIAFRVASSVDSRVVLDDVGAEDLLGRGDALVQLGDGSDLRRVQFPNVSEGEVERVVAFLRGAVS